MGGGGEGHIVGLRCLCCCSSHYHHSRCHHCHCHSCCCRSCRCCSSCWCCTYTRPPHRCVPTFPSVCLSLRSPAHTLAFGRARSCLFVHFVCACSCSSMLIRAHLCFDGSICEFRSLSCIKYIVIRCIIIINTPLYPARLAFILARSCLSHRLFVPARLAFIRSQLCSVVLVRACFVLVRIRFVLIRTCLCLLGLLCLYEIHN